MAELQEAYLPETRQIIHEFLSKPVDGIAQCANYGTTEFMGASNACVCSRMGHTEAANIMRDGLMDEFLHSGTDSLQAHLKFVFETWDKPGGGFPLVSLIAKNGMECPGVVNDALKSIGSSGPVNEQSLPLYVN
jgi:hypothetical protein